MVPDPVSELVRGGHIVTLCVEPDYPARRELERSYRPMSYYQSIDNGERYQAKRIFVKHGGSLSLPEHLRAEHLLVVRTSPR